MRKTNNISVICIHSSTRTLHWSLAVPVQEKTWLTLTSAERSIKQKISTHLLYYISRIYPNFTQIGERWDISRPTDFPFTHC